jgi:hypothetical protein
MRVQEIREEETEDERDKHLNTIRPVIPMKQEWRVKEKVDAPAPMTSDDDMDLLDDNKAPLIKDGSLPLTDMDINMMFTLPIEFRGAEDIAQMCLSPKEVVFEKPEESNQHLKSLYVQSHIDGKLISSMLIDDGATINLIPYSIFKKLGREDKELIKTNPMLNVVGGNPMETRVVVSMELIVGSKSLTTMFFVIEV